MKKVIILVGLIGSLNAHASDSASCQLIEQIFTTRDYINYELQKEQLVSDQSKLHRDGEVTLSDEFGDVSYSITLNYPQERIYGELVLRVDQFNAKDHVETNHRLYAHLSVEDSYNGGKTVYSLKCQFD